MASFIESYHMYVVVLHDYNTGEDIEFDKPFVRFEDAEECAKRSLLEHKCTGDNPVAAVIKANILRDIKTFTIWPGKKVEVVDRI